MGTSRARRHPITAIGRWNALRRGGPPRHPASTDVFRLTALVHSRQRRERGRHCPSDMQETGLDPRTVGGETVSAACGAHACRAMPKTLVSSNPSTRPAFALQGTRTQALDGHFLADHLGWWRPTSHPRSWCRLVEGAAAPRLLTSPELHVAGDAGHPRPDELRLPPEVARLLPSPLARRLAARTPLLRLGTTTVWEAAATAVVRQVVHRDQARAAFERLSVAFGSPALVGGHVRHTFPTAEQLLAVSDEQLRGCGIGFKARTLRTLATWCLDVREHLDADELHEQLQSVAGIGPWTSAVTVCDRFSDFRFYPVEDLAVRAHARAHWPRKWPDAPAAFAREWRAATAPHTAAVTAFLLAESVLSER